MKKMNIGVRELRVIVPTDGSLPILLSSGQKCISCFLTSLFQAKFI